MSDISRETLIPAIAFVQFPDQPDSNRLANPVRQMLFESMNKFRKALVKRNISTISDATIRGWTLQDPPRVPKRDDAFVFLNDYVRNSLYKDEYNTSKQELIESIRNFLTIATLNPTFSADNNDSGSELLAHQLDQPTSTKFVLRKFAPKTKIDALQGVYQIIRPYINVNNRYILEPMEIANTEDGEPCVYMYSHNQPGKEFIYYGDAFLSSRYLFSLVKRKHENIDPMFSIRCIALFANQQRVGIVSRYCLSGLMLRGVKGNKGMQGPVAIPFVAIKLANDPVGIKDSNFQQLRSTLYRVSYGGHILLGEVNEKMHGLYQYCFQLYSVLLESDLIMKKSFLGAVDPIELQELIVPDATDMSEYANSWVEVVRDYYREWDENYAKKK